MFEVAGVCQPRVKYCKEGISNPNSSIQRVKVVPPILDKEKHGRYLTEPTGSKAGPKDITSPPQRHRDAFNADAQVHEEQHACKR